MIKLFSRGIRRIPNLEYFLSEEISSASAYIAGWGHKITAEKARKAAASNALTYLSLEDGFIRSTELGVNGAPPLSLQVDPVGCYYDAGQPSLLENLLNSSRLWMSDKLKTRARNLINYLILEDLSKYNVSPSMPEGWLRSTFGLDSSCKCILLIDQTVGDASVALGGAGAEDFEKMLADAVSQNPEAAIFIRSHPDVVAGKKKGYFNIIPPSVFRLDSSFSPLSTLREFDEVYTVTSQMGFDALLLNKPVHVYGIPFYAGWGITLDQKKISRRTSRVDIETLTAAALLKTCRYVNPFSRERVEAEEVCEIIADQKRQRLRNRGHHVVVDMPFWKKGHINAFLSGEDSSVYFCKDAKSGIEKARKLQGEIVVWASRESDSLQSCAAAEGVTVRRVEDGFLRSCGLGVDFHLPYSLCFDYNGIYYDPSSDSDLLRILNSLNTRTDLNRLRERAAKLQHIITTNHLSKYNVGKQSKLPYLGDKRKKILVIGQVSSDAAIKKGCEQAATRNNTDLLQRVRIENPSSCIIYKPHPDVMAGRKPGSVSQEILNSNTDYVIGDVSIADSIYFADEIHTLTSLAGFEALLARKKVVTYGFPFYAGWGLTIDKEKQFGRKRKIDLEELLIGTLLLYPSYYDWQLHDFCRPEDVCFRMIHKDQHRADLWSEFCRYMFKLKNFFGKTIHV
jgi:capsular polysaccharide export protein